MYKSLADQTEEQLGGWFSVLSRQKRDHVELDRLIHAIENARGREREEQLTVLCRLVFPHAFAEESVLWPYLRRHVPDGEELTLHIEQEHQEINDLFTELEKLDPDSAEHRELFTRIVAVLREDVRDEEDELLPRFQNRSSRTELVRMGAAWEAVRRTAPTRPHPVVARRPPGNVLAAAPLTVLDRARDRLDRLARADRRFSAAARSGGHLLARAAGRIEHITPLTKGEDPSTHSAETSREEHRSSVPQQH